MNRLGEETSPYLLQHRENPVHWQAWGDAAFAEARASGKPVLLSVGYAACHWCHVMAHESFENAATAAVMNELFVNVKVDREELPDVDAVYQHALAALGQQGGWPLTMFLTPDRAPFWGGTYFPPEARWGRPGFRDVLRMIATAYRDEPEKVTGNVAALRQALDKMAEPAAGTGINRTMTDAIAERLLEAVDKELGGFGEAPKFPQVPVFLLLWRAWLRTRNPAYRDAVVHTLRCMSRGGIYDHLAGGFARYSTDARWLVPHFEKMLYDNAELIELLTLVWADTREPLFEARVRESIDWLLREMVAAPADEGTAGFAASQDADSEGEEGKFAVWSAAEVDAVLRDDAPVFRRVYDVTDEGNWEGHNILNRLSSPDPEPPEVEAVLARSRQALKAVRDRRVQPGRDDKVLVDWNGLAIAALARAAGIFGEPAWLEAARRAFAFVDRHMVAEDGRLRHSWRLGRLSHASTLDDHASLARAALALHAATGEAAYLDRAIDLAGAMEQHFADRTAGGYFMSPADSPLPVRPKLAHDGATPSGNGMAVEVLARLWHLTGDTRWEIRSRAAVAAFAGEIGRNFVPLATLINANELLEAANELILVGEPGDPAFGELVAAARASGAPDLVPNVVPAGTALPDGHPAAEKALLSALPAAFLCRQGVCSPPIRDPASLAAALSAVE